MTGTLESPDGLVIKLGDRTPGGSKNHTCYGTLPDGRDVVVKLQASHGRLPDEEIALRYATGRGLRVPQVINSWATADRGYCLVLSREPGRRTDEPDGWRRMGGELARLAAVALRDCPLASVDGDAFRVDHLRRLAVIEPLITGHRHRLADAVDRLAAGRPTLTHGDPGSGNYLDHESGGTILDWETATIAPFGIDIGRAGFIALMDLHRTGQPAALNAAVTSGYRAGLGAGPAVDEPTIAAATIVAGLQFVHGRYTRPLRSDRTATMAADVLINYLHRS